MLPNSFFTIYPRITKHKYTVLKVIKLRLKVITVRTIKLQVKDPF